MLLGTRAFPQMSDVQPNMRQRALFVTSAAACRWNRMPLARENVDNPLAAIVVATEHNAQWNVVFRFRMIQFERYLNLLTSKSQN